MAENRLTVVRHGETEWSRDGKHTGRTDIPLTDVGRTVAAKLAQALGDRTYALVLTSPLARARDTAAIAGFPDAVVDEDLREWDYGDYEARTTPEIRRSGDADWLLWEHGVPNGETLSDVAARADRVIRRVRTLDGDVLAFAARTLPPRPRLPLARRRPRVRTPPRALARDSVSSGMGASRSSDRSLERSYRLTRVLCGSARRRGTATARRRPRRHREVEVVGPVSLCSAVGNGARGLQRRRHRVGLLPS